MRSLKLIGLVVAVAVAALMLAVPAGTVAQDEMVRIDGNRFAVALAPARRLDLETVIQIAGRLKSTVAVPVSIDACAGSVSGAGE